MTSLKKKFTKEQLSELPYDPPEGGEIISDKIIDTSRWESINELIVQFPNQMGTNEAYLFHYRKGLTEYQESVPWEFDDQVEGTLVKQIEKIVKVWEPVSEY